MLHPQRCTVLPHIEWCWRWHRRCSLHQRDMDRKATTPPPRCIDLRGSVMEVFMAIRTPCPTSNWDIRASVYVSVCTCARRRRCYLKDTTTVTATSRQRDSTCRLLRCSCHCTPVSSILAHRRTCSPDIDRCTSPWWRLTSCRSARAGTPCTLMSQQVRTDPQHTLQSMMTMTAQSWSRTCQQDI